MDEAGKVRNSDKLDWISLEQYLKKIMPYLNGNLSVRQFHGGHANLSYLIQFSDFEMVLRRPPFGKIAPGAHDMKREYDVLSKLNEYYPLAPKTYHYCDIAEIIGAPFVLLERRKGIVMRYQIPEEFKLFENIEMRLSNALIDAHCDLHLIDYKKVNLAEIGKSEGFLERQLFGWKKRMNLVHKENLGLMTEISKKLESNIPQTIHSSIIHNDFKFDNCQFSPDNPDIVQSVFDWDMCTIGDPLFDFASSLVYWPDSFFEGIEMPLLLEGDFPTKDYMKKRYFEITGFQSDSFIWYEILAYWKTTIIAQQLLSRYLKSKDKNPKLEKFKLIIPAFSAKAKNLIDRYL